MAKQKWVKKLEEWCEKNGWRFKMDGADVLLETFSPAGQDHALEDRVKNLEGLQRFLRDTCDNWDTSEQTYAWLDNFGHGTNGAPYDMKDVYEDMEWCLEATEKLRDFVEGLEE